MQKVILTLQIVWMKSSGRMRRSNECLMNSAARVWEWLMSNLCKNYPCDGWSVLQALTMLSREKNVGGSITLPVIDYRIVSFNQFPRPGGKDTCSCEQQFLTHHGGGALEVDGIDEEDFFRRRASLHWLPGCALPWHMHHSWLMRIVNMSGCF